MLDVEIRVKNYRCFGDEPAIVRIADGFTSFIGVNNSGKSSMLRLFYEIRPLLAILARNNNGQRDMLHQRGQVQVWSPQLLTGERAFRADVSRPVEIAFVVHDGPLGPFQLNGDQLVALVKYELNEQNNGLTTLEIRKENGSEVMGPKFSTSYPDLEISPFTQALELLFDSMYIGPFRNAIHVGADEQYYDINTGNQFVRTFANLKSGPNPAENEAVAELIVEVGRIFGFDRLDLNATPDSRTLQMTVGGRSYRLTEQGAGLAHFIVVLVNVLVRRPSLLLIDEPELNLHASLQMDFLTTLARYTKHGVVFATHSLGLARTAADRIFTFSKPVGEASRVRQYEAEPDLVTLLGQLSFDGRPELGFSKVLLVEGKSEVRAIMQLLRLYRKEHEVLVLPLHGDSLIQPDTGQELEQMLRLGAEAHLSARSSTRFTFGSGFANTPMRSAKIDFTLVNIYSSLDGCYFYGLRNASTRYSSKDNGGSSSSFSFKR